MDKIITKKSDINSLEDLRIYQRQLKRTFLRKEDEIKSDVTTTLISLPWRMLEKKPTDLSHLRYVSVKDFAVGVTPVVVKKVLPKKTGFFNRLLISFIAKKTVAKLFKENNTPILKKEKSITLNIDMNNATSNPINKTEKVEVSPPKPKEKLSFKGIFDVLKNAFTGFGDHKVTKMSGSLAYYTVFSMAPLLVVVIALCGFFLKKDAAEGQILLQLKGFLGNETAGQLQDLIKKAAIGDKGIIASIIGGVTLIIGATSIFADIQDSINTIWGIKPKPKRGWLKMLQNRFLSFSVIISLGFLLLVSLGVSAILDGFSNRLQAKFQDVSVVFFYILNTVITLGVVSTIFGVIFKVLPDAKIRWRDVISGAMVTAILFMIGKFGISFYIGKSDIGGTYGAAGSMVILLLWAYYSSIILYFGAEFTKAYAVKYGAEISPNAYAVTLKEVEVEQENASVQDVEQSKNS